MRQLTVTKEFSEYQILWKNRSERIDIRWSVENIDGQHWICGAVKQVNGTNFMANRKVLRKSWIRHKDPKGKVVLRDLRFFTLLKRNDPFVGAKATCRGTGLKPNREFYYIGFDHFTANFM